MLIYVLYIYIYMRLKIDAQRCYVFHRCCRSCSQSKRKWVLLNATNRGPLDLPCAGARSHLDDMQIAFHWGRDLIQSYFPPQVIFSTDNISCLDIYSVSVLDANDSRICSLLFVAGASVCAWRRLKQMVAQCDVWRMHGGTGRTLLVPCLHPSVFPSLVSPHFLSSQHFLKTQP